MCLFITVHIFIIIFIVKKVKRTGEQQWPLQLYKNVMKSSFLPSEKFPELLMESCILKKKS